MRILVGVSIVVAVAAVSHADPITAPTCGPAVENAPAPRSVRDVDWCNFDYSFWKGEMREGHSEVHLYEKLGQPHDTIAHHLRGVVYGDFDGDKRTDAAVVIENDSWFEKTQHGSSSTEIYIYTFVKRRPALVGSIAAGTPVRVITFGKGTISVTSGPDTSITNVRYRRGKAGFVELP